MQRQHEKPTSGRWKLARGMIAVLVAFSVLAIGSPASAGSPFVSTSNDWVTLEVVEGGDYVVKGQVVEYRYAVTAKKNLHRVGLLGDDSDCPGKDFGRINNGSTEYFYCNILVTHAGMDIVNKIGTRRWSYSGTNYLNHMVVPDVINPKIDVELLDIPTNGGMWLIGQQTPMSAKVTNTGDVPLKEVTIDVQGCSGNFDIAFLAVGASTTRTCIQALPSGQGLGDKEINVFAQGTPNVSGTFEPSSFRAQATDVRTYEVLDANAQIKVEVLNASNGGLGWPIENPYGQFQIRMTNESNLPANMESIESTDADCTGQEFANVPAGASRTFSCTVDVLKPAGFNVKGQLQIVGLPTTSSTWTDTDVGYGDITLNPLRIFDVVRNPAAGTLTFSLQNIGTESIQVFRPNITTYPGCTSTNPLPYVTTMAGLTQNQNPNPSIQTMTCSINAWGMNMAYAPALRISGTYLGKAYIEKYGQMPLIPVSSGGANG